MLSPEATKFADSALEAINAIVPLTDAQFEAIRDDLAERAHAFERECVDQVKALCVESVQRVSA